MIKRYPNEILKLQHPAGFCAKFHELISVSETYEKAYEKVEELHLHFFGFRKYSSYSSFRQINNRQIKKEQEM